MNEILSRIVADLFVKTKGGEELSSKIQRLRDEIKKVIGSEDTIFGKLRGLVESFREIIPEERQRYNAAIKALSTTSRLSRQEIIKALNNPLDELRILEKVLMPALPGWRDELKVMEAKSGEMKSEISKLREKIVQLESEEKAISDAMATRQKEMELVEKAMKELFTDIGVEITYVKTKVEEFTAESAAAQPIPPRDSVKSDIPSEKAASAASQPIPPKDSIFPSEERGGGGQKSEIHKPESPAPQDTEWQKKCPMCGGRMDFHGGEKLWMCYTCAFEELEKGEVSRKSEIQGKSEEKGEEKSEIHKPESSAPQDTEWQKKCPMCGGRMDFHRGEKLWMCYTCAYEESEKDAVQGKSEGKSELTNAPKPTPASEPISEPFSPLAEPLTSLSFNEEPIKGSIKGSSPFKKQQSSKKKPCPACHKKMNWHETEKAWRCPFCEYERRI